MKPRGSRRRSFIFFASLAMLPGSGSFSSFSARAAATAAGVTAAPILQVPLSPRAMGMGSAFTAMTEDLSALYYNPAALATLDAPQVSGGFIQGLSDQNIQTLSGGAPVSFMGLTENGHVTVGGAFVYGQNGSIELNRTNPDGSFKDSQSISAGGDLVGSLTYAERVADTTVELGHRNVHVYHYAGISGKVIHSTLAQQYSATASAGDAGYLATAPDLGWNVGVSVLNLGNKMAFLQQGDNLPLTFRLGAAYQYEADPLRSTPQSWTFAADGEYSAYQKQLRVNAGAEYFVMNSISARLGYRFNQDIGGVTAGFGVRWGDFLLDYAWAMSNTINDTHRIGLTYRFSHFGTWLQEKVHGKVIMEDTEQPARNKSTPAPRPQNPKPEKSQEIPNWIY